MAFDPFFQQVVDDFSSVVSDDLLVNICSLIMSSYDESRDPIFTSRFHPKIIKQYRPLIRKGFIDTDLEALVGGSNKIEGGVKENCNRSHLYTELIVDEKIILTSSVVSSPKSLPRKSVFRLEASKNNPVVRQLDCIDENVVRVDFINKKVDIKKLYAIILHGPSKGSAPDFIKIAIPDHDYRTYLRTIDLLPMYSQRQTEPDVNLNTEEMVMPKIRLKRVVDEYIEDEDRIVGDINIEQNRNGERNET